MACSRLSSQEAAEGTRAQRRFGADELPGIGGWFFACSGRGTETLAGCILLLARFPGPSHLRVSALPNEDVLAVISASFLDSSGHH